MSHQQVESATSPYDWHCLWLKIIAFLCAAIVVVQWMTDRCRDNNCLTCCGHDVTLRQRLLLNTPCEGTEDKGPCLFVIFCFPPLIICSVSWKVSEILNSEGVVMHIDGVQSTTQLQHLCRYGPQSTDPIDLLKFPIVNASSSQNKHSSGLEHEYATSQFPKISVRPCLCINAKVRGSESHIRYRTIRIQNCQGRWGYFVQRIHLISNKYRMIRFGNCKRAEVNCYRLS